MNQKQLSAYSELIKSREIGESKRLLTESIAARKMVSAPALVESWAKLMYQLEHADPADVPKLKVMLDSLFKMMSKVLPDIKAVEIEQMEPSEATVIHLDPEHYAKVRKSMLEKDDC